MGHKRAKLATAKAKAMMKNIINLDEEDEVLTELERGKIVVGLDLGAELKRNNEFFIIGTYGAWILKLLCINTSRKTKSCFSG